MAEKLRRIEQKLVSESQSARPPTVIPTADLRERLRSLGYVN
jgi:hypothetical protein